MLSDKLANDATVVLYACWAGFPGGFSTILQKKVGKGVWVYGHTSKGHSFANPEVSEVQQSRSPTFRQLFAGSALFSAWDEALLYTDMWLRFPIMWDQYIERELNAIRLLGRWNALGATKYLFEWSRTNSTYDSLESLNQNPNGTVKDETNRISGTWTVNEQLEISWESGEVEKWPLPIRPNGQPVSGDVGLAVRLTHTLPGSRQG